MESEEEDQNEEEGEGNENGNQFMVGFMFGNVGKDMRLEEDYLDEDVREQLEALQGDVDKLDGGMLQKQAEGSARAKAATKVGPADEKAPDAQNFSDEEDMIDDEDAPAEALATPAVSSAPQLLVMAAQAPQANVEEDDYDADEDAPAAAPAPLAPVVAPPSITLFPTAQAVPEAAPAVPQVIDLSDEDEEMSEGTPAPELSLPLLADLGTAKILRFSEMFTPALMQTGTKKRKAQRSTPAEAAGISAEPEVDDDMHLLETDEVDAEGIEADTWASEVDSASASDAEAEAEEASLQQAGCLAESKDEAQPAQRVTDAAPSQRPPPARRKPKPLHGGNPLGNEKSEHSLALLQASKAITSAQFAPVIQLEWESSVDWGDQEPSRQAASLPNLEEHEGTSSAGMLALPSVELKSGPSQDDTGTRMLATLRWTEAYSALAQGSHLTSEHPQLLRLEKAVLRMLQAKSPQGGDGGQGQDVTGAFKRLLVEWAKSTRAPNQALQDLLWMSEVADVPQMLLEQGHLPLLLDLNDANLTFEMLHGHSTSELQRAPATIIPAKSKVVPVMAALIGSGEGAAQLARFNVSKDALYSTRTRQKGTGLPSKHALPALVLATLPAKQPGCELLHRPVSTFIPSPSAHAQVKGVKIKLAGSGSQLGGATVSLSSLVGHDSLAQTFNGIDLTKTSAQQLWEQAQKAKFAVAGNKEPVFWLKNDPVRLLDGDASLKDAKVPAEARIDLAVSFPGIELLPDSSANKVPDPSKGTPLQPPGAFTKKKDLTAAEGHVVMLEYLEEQPLLLARPGMSAHLTTFYRREDATDTGHTKLLEGDEKWRIGYVEVLQPEDEEPSILTSVKRGQTRMAVDTYMFKTGAFPHRPKSSDFLLIRSAAGVLSVRHLTGSIMVGQQEPQMRIPAPKTKEAKDIVESRLVVNVFRELRRKQLKLEKGRSSGVASVSLAQLKRSFPTLSTYDITSRLRDRCECQPLPDDPTGDVHMLKPGSNIPAEGDLRKLLTPDMWCAHESMALGQARLKETGLKHIPTLAQIHPDHLRLAFEQLPLSAELEQAFRALEKAVWGCPWELTDNFISAMREGRGRLTLSGPGDPTGRGLGFSFWRDEHKSLLEGSASQKKDAGQITGTSADLRKLSMKESHRILKNYGVTETEIKALSRWQRISLVRDLANAKVQDGDSTVSARYARERKHSALELLEKARHKARNVFDRQAAALAEKQAVEDDSEMSDTETTITEGQSQAVSQNGPSRMPAAISKPGGKKEKKKPKASAVSEADEARELAEMRKGGFITGEGKKGPVGKLEAPAGTRRIRRTITHTLPSGEKASREVIITDQEKMALLSSLYGDPAGGFGTRTVTEGSTAVTLKPSPAPKTKKSGKRTSAKCQACGEIGHTAKNKACPMYGRAADDLEDDLMDSLVKRPVKSRRRSVALNPPDSQITGTCKSQRSQDAEEEDSDADALEDAGLHTLPTAPSQPEAEEGIVPQESKPKKAPSKRSSKKSAPNARKYLAQRVLSPAFNEMKRQQPQALTYFKKPVQLAQVPDYSIYVAKEDEMCFEAIERKLKEVQYSSASEFLTDIDQIVSNAVAYNSPYCGDRGHQGVIDAAMAMETTVRDELSYAPEKLEEAEAQVRQEDAAAQPAEPEQAQPEQMEEPAAEYWVQCESCKKWRNLSKDVYDQTVNEIDPWYCFMNTDRESAGCDEPDDYLESAEQSVEIL